jgi:segregation and condensation protein B
MTNMSNEISEESLAAEDEHLPLEEGSSTAGEESFAPDESAPAAGEFVAPESEDATEAAPVAAEGQKPSAELLQRIVEGALLAAGKPLAVEDLAALFEDSERPTTQEIRTALEGIAAQSIERGFELREVASGFRFQVVQEVAPWIARLWEEKPQKYSRALLETLALIAYRQPITRGDIEDIRGVAVATNIIKTLLERDWVRVVGHKDVPGRPAMYATTRRFLDYFNLKNLDELPALADLRDLDALSAQLSLEGADTVLPEQQEAAGEGGEESAQATIDLAEQSADDTAPVEAAAVAAVPAGDGESETTDNEDDGEPQSLPGSDH